MVIAMLMRRENGIRKKKVFIIAVSADNIQL
jgi:hypothetical protein